MLNLRSRWEMEQRGSSEGFANSESQVQSQHFTNLALFEEYFKI